MVTMNSSEKAAQKACQGRSGPSRENSKCGIQTSNAKDGGSAVSASAGANQQAVTAIIPQTDESPNYLVYKKMENIIERMQDEVTGVPVRTVKSFMSKIPSVFTGSDLVAWLCRHLHLEETWEALHLGHLLSAHGYLFPIDDHCLTVKNDNTYYRFQTPYFWPSNQWEPENTDYAVYLCKRTMQNKARLELADYEAESLARLQKMFSRKWEFIFMQAEAQSKVDKKRDKLERKVLDSQERAFWDVHRPMPGCVNTTETDARKCRRLTAVKLLKLEIESQHLAQKQQIAGNPIVTITNPQESEEEINKKKSVEDKENDTTVTTQPESTAKPPNKPSTTPEATVEAQPQEPAPDSDQAEIEAARRNLVMLRQRLERRNVKVSKVADMCISYYEQYAEYDAFLTAPELPNPWLADTTDLWDQDKQWISVGKPGFLTFREVPPLHPSERSRSKEWVAVRRVRRWAFGLRELLQDSAGRDHFARFLDKEFSGENLRFWLAVQELKALPIRRVNAFARDIWKEFLAADASSPVNVDAASREATRLKVEQGTDDRWCFDHAQAHVYHLMKSDSYSRYLRSEMYRDYLNGSKKKTSVKGIRSIVSFTARKETSSS